jgi:hypothetical protein
MLDVDHPDFFVGFAALLGRPWGTRRTFREGM